MQCCFCKVTNSLCIIYLHNEELLSSTKQLVRKLSSRNKLCIPGALAETWSHPPAESQPAQAQSSG